MVHFQLKVSQYYILIVEAYTMNYNYSISLLKISRENRGSQDFNVKILHLQTIKKFETLKAAAFKSMVLQSWCISNHKCDICTSFQVEFQLDHKLQCSFGKCIETSKYQYFFTIKEFLWLVVCRSMTLKAKFTYLKKFSVEKYF